MKTIWRQKIVQKHKNASAALYQPRHDKVIKPCDWVISWCLRAAALPGFRTFLAFLMRFKCRSILGKRKSWRKQETLLTPQDTTSNKSLQFQFYARSSLVQKFAALISQGLTPRNASGKGGEVLSHAASRTLWQQRQNKKRTLQLFRRVSHVARRVSKQFLPSKQITKLN